MLRSAIEHYGCGSAASLTRGPNKIHVIHLTRSGRNLRYRTHRPDLAQTRTVVAEPESIKPHRIH